MTESAPTGCGPEGTESPRPGAGEGAAAWEAFEARLVRAIGKMDIESFLILELPPDDAGARGYVQFARWAREGTVRGVRAEASGSDYFAATRPLTPAQLSRLRRLGWRSPRSSDGTCRNHWREWPEPAPAAEVASVAAATLREVYGVGLPGQLRALYRLFGTGATADLGLGLQPIADERPSGRGGDRSFGELRASVEAGLKAWCGDRGLMVDGDGDYGVPVDGGAQVYVRLLDGAPPVAAVFSVLAVGIPESPALFLALNAINTRLRFGRAWWEDGRITLGAELSGLGLTGEQVGHACVELARMAAVLDDDLHGRFGGRMAPGAGPALAN